MNRRLIGSALGVLIGMGLVIYFDKNEAVSQTTEASAAASAITVTAANDTNVYALRELSEQQAEEIARLRRGKEAGDALNLLRSKQTPPDPTRPDLASYRALSPRELSNEIETAVDEAASYTSGGIYAPQRHRDLHRRINTLWDLRGLTPTQNKWLAEAAKELNELAVHHAEEAVEKGSNDEVVAVVTGLGDWAFRLNDDQEKRLVAAVEIVASRYH